MRFLNQESQFTHVVCLASTKSSKMDTIKHCEGIRFLVVTPRLPGVVVLEAKRIQSEIVSSKRFFNH